MLMKTTNTIVVHPVPLSPQNHNDNILQRTTTQQANNNENKQQKNVRCITSFFRNENTKQSRYHFIETITNKR